MSQVITTEAQWKVYVEDMTGNKSGGTCHRPDIRLNGACDPCEYSKYCLVEGKLLLTNRQEKRKIN